MALPTRSARRASGAVRRFPDLRSAVRQLHRSTIVKSVVGVAVLTGVGVALTVPQDLEPAQALSLPAANAALAQVRSQGSSDSLSRSTLRTGTLDALEAPDALAPQPGVEVGVSGVKAVAKPVEKAAPKTTSGGSTAPGGSGPAATSSRSYTLGSCGGGLTTNACKVYSAVKSAFGISNIGGLRPGDPGDHGSGRAVDVMITSQSQGDAVASFALAHVGDFGIKYVIWRQRIWTTSSPYWRPMEDRGSITANHYDHVHISVY